MPIDSALRLSIHGRLRHYPADSPSTSDRIEFTSTPPTGSLCCGLVVLVALLSTSCCHDAVTSRYPTASAAGERTSTAPSCCLLRRTGDGRAATIQPAERARRHGGSKALAPSRAKSHLRQLGDAPLAVRLFVSPLPPTSLSYSRERRAIGATDRAPAATGPGAIGRLVRSFSGSGARPALRRTR